MRRACAVLLLVIALGMVLLAFTLNPQVASLVTSGVVLAALVAFLDVDKVIGRGSVHGD